ncbi:MAG TPA: hypothetical protein VGZ89_14035, partial [Xanthobacteraceae bacterium]|nr:hypothetical protein [Xanthobacteraceae bacterium]
PAQAGARSRKAQSGGGPATLRFFSAAAWGPTAVQDFTCDEWPLFKIQHGIEIDRFCHGN